MLVRGIGGGGERDRRRQLGRGDGVDVARRQAREAVWHVSGFWSDVPSAFWSIGAPSWNPKVGSVELIVIDQAVSVPVLLDWVSSMVSV